MIRRKKFTYILAAFVGALFIVILASAILGVQIEKNPLSDKKRSEYNDTMVPPGVTGLPQ